MLFPVSHTLQGYDLFGYVDGCHVCPSSTVTTATGSTLNPAHISWIRHVQLILSTIIGALTPTLIPFIASAKTSKATWDILANTYGKPNKGRIISLKNKIRSPQKGNKSITDYMLGIKEVVDKLALLGVSTDPEDLVLKVLNGLENSYKELSNAIQA